MKKLLVVLLSAAMVLSVAAVSMAAITTNGQLEFKYDFGTGVEKTDARIWFTGKVNDELSAYVRLRANNAQLNVDYYYFTVAKEWATFQAGRWEFVTDGNVDILTSIEFLRDDLTQTYGDVPKTNYDWAVLTTIPFGDAFKGYVWYNPGDDKAATGRNNYALGLNYAAGIWNADLFYLNTDTSDANDETGYIVNLSIAPTDAFKAYLHYGHEDDIAGDDDQFTILGFTYKFDKVLFRGEYDLDDEDGANGINPWGFAVSYYADNGIEWKFTRANKSDTSETVELKTIVKF